MKKYPEFPFKLHVYEVKEITRLIHIRIRSTKSIFIDFY